MNGAESAVRTAIDAGVEVCFANPGTTEMHLVAALDSVPGLRPILGLFEGVATGAADGYGRMAGRPALTLLHLGPGFANGIANLHNARRARTPVVNVVGDQATWHVAADAPLTSDIESLARPVSSWVRTSSGAKNVGTDMAEAIAAARNAPGGVATLIVPADCAWDPGAGSAKPVEPEAPSAVPGSRIEAAAAVLRDAAPSLLLLGGPALRAPELRIAARIAARSGAQLMADTFISRLERGAGLPAVARLPYFPEQVMGALQPYAHLIAIGTRSPVSFFGYPSQPSRPIPDGCSVQVLAGPADDCAAALEELAQVLGARGEGELASAERPAIPTGELGVGSLGLALSALLPEGAIVVDEAATSGAAYHATSAGCPPHTVLGLTGGAIGQGLPCATGAAVACPDRPVIAFEADGSGMYTVQSLWTQAREDLNVTTLVCANREYRILKLELGRADIVQPGPAARALTDLGRPVLDWVGLARAQGVPGERAETADELVAALGRAFADTGPYLIEAVI
ncbi:MAG: acetolactate synthase large subunit [Myxococcota bacterium]